MTKEEVAEIVHGMPQGMDADDYLVELVSRVVAIEREACAKLLDDMAAKDKLSNYYGVAARAIRANRSLATTSAGKPNYRTPQVTPQVTPEVKWVGLTDDERHDVLEDATGDGGHVYYDTLFRTIEAKLKEKNT